MKTILTLFFFTAALVLSACCSSVPAKENSPAGTTQSAPTVHQHIGVSQEGNLDAI